LTAPTRPFPFDRAEALRLLEELRRAVDPLPDDELLRAAVCLALDALALDARLFERELFPELDPERDDVRFADEDRLFDGREPAPERDCDWGILALLARSLFVLAYPEFARSPHLGPPWV
jgi:hypothetical protein